MGRSKLAGGMGFRDLEAFNIALLAKQGWRFLQHPDSMVATIFKEKCFKGGNFLQAPVGHNSSYVWRSITKAKPSLIRGLRWRVGNGESIMVWRDKWLPGIILNHEGISGRSTNPDMRVSELID